MTLPPRPTPAIDLDTVAKTLTEAFNNDPSDGLTNSFGEAMRRCASAAISLLTPPASPVEGEAVAKSLAEQHYPDGWAALRGRPFPSGELDAIRRWSKAHLDEVASNVAWNDANPREKPKGPNVPSSRWVLADRMLATYGTTPPSPSRLAATCALLKDCAPFVKTHTNDPLLPHEIELVSDENALVVHARVKAYLEGQS